MLIINFEGREAKGLSKGRYDETFAGEDAGPDEMSHFWHLICVYAVCRDTYWPDHEIFILNLVSVDHFKKDSEAINNILKDLVILSFG